MLLQPDDLMQHARQHTRSFDAAYDRLKEASDAAMRKFLKRLRQETRSALTASSGVDPRRLNPQLFSVGAAKGWWAGILREEMEDALFAVWMGARAATTDATLAVGTLDAAGDYLAKVVDRLSTTATPTIPEQAFDTVRQALIEEMADDRSPKQMAERIAAELQWQGQDRGYWESRQQGAERRLNDYLDTNYGTKYIEDPLTGERRLNAERDLARRTDPEADRIQRQISQATQRLDRDQSTWQARSDRIARTETTAAYNAGIQSAYLDEGIEYKMWIALGDERTRETHVDAHGQCVLADEWFNVGADQLFFPGDPSGSAEEIINCRCTTIAAKTCEDLQQMVEDVEGPLDLGEVTDEEIADLAAEIFGYTPDPLALTPDDDDDPVGLQNGLAAAEYSQETYETMFNLTKDIEESELKGLLTEEQSENLQDELAGPEELINQADELINDARAAEDLANDEDAGLTEEEKAEKLEFAALKIEEAGLMLKEAEGYLADVKKDYKIALSVQQKATQAPPPSAPRTISATQAGTLTDAGKETLANGQDFGTHIRLADGSEYLDTEAQAWKDDTLAYTEKFNQHIDPRVITTVDKYGNTQHEHLSRLTIVGTDTKPTTHSALTAGFTQDGSSAKYNTVDTVNEAAAHWSYVGNKNIQDTLRTGGVDPTSEGIVKAAHNHNMPASDFAALMQQRADTAIVQLDHGIDTSRDHGGFVSYRGSNLKYIEDHMGKDIAARMSGETGLDPKSLIGLEYSDKAYTATSVDPDVGRMFGFQLQMEKEFEDHPAILYEIIVPDGVGALSINGTSAGSSMFAEESEMLLGRDQKFRIVDVVSPYHSDTLDLMKGAGFFPDDPDLEGYDSVTQETASDMLAAKTLPIIVRVEAIG